MKNYNRITNTLAFHTNYLPTPAKAATPFVSKSPKEPHVLQLDRCTKSLQVNRVWLYSYAYNEAYLYSRWSVITMPTTILDTSTNAITSSLTPSPRAQAHIVLAITYLSGTHCSQFFSLNHYPSTFFTLEKGNNCPLR